ncbi:MAG: ComEC/Rec2 family competence protein [Bryobacteraceae bacterium]
MRVLAAVALAAVSAAVLSAAATLQIYAIDVEGGQATLLVTPAGDSLLIDAGWPGHNQRDANRIVAAAKAAHVKRIDWLLVTHFHADHVGGVYQLAQKMPIVHFVDHGSSVEKGKDAQILYNEYAAVRAKGEHLRVEAGGTIPVKGIDVQVLSAGGNVLDLPLGDAGAANPDCNADEIPPETKDENGQSIGVLITYEDFRMLDMGDLTKDREYQLVCPVNKIGAVDFLLVSHHGSDLSSSAPFVHAVSPRVALVDNGPHKGGSAEVWQTLHDTRGLLDIWQLHYAIDADKQHNSPDTFIANVDANCEGKWIKVTAEKNGTFTVYNTRNKFEKKYVKR